MTSEPDALQRIIDLVTPLLTEQTPLADASGSWSLAAVHATTPLPGFDNSAMDGYAVRSQDTQAAKPLPVMAAIPAGTTSTTSLQPGSAIRIFTGAPMPTGADAVIMQEDVTLDREAQTIICREPVELGENVRRTGCDLCMGQRIVAPGELLTPARLAALASQGLTTVSTARAPRVAIVTTGDELVPPGTALLPGQIYNSNGIMLGALVQQTLPAVHLTTSHLPDQLEQTTRVLSHIVATHDFLIISGGVSVGDHDCVKPALKALGIAADFWRVKVKPGKPVLFARAPREGGVCHIFGLPGNPVSSHVTFHLFVRPALLHASGVGTAALTLPAVRAVLSTPLRNRGDRPHYIRGRYHDGSFTPSGVQQSHALFGLSQANAYVRMDPEQDLAPGAEVTALLWA